MDQESMRTIIVRPNILRRRNAGSSLRSTTHSGESSPMYPLLSTNQCNQSDSYLMHDLNNSVILERPASDSALNRDDGAVTRINPELNYETQFTSHSDNENGNPDEGDFQFPCSFSQEEIGALENCYKLYSMFSQNHDEFDRAMVSNSENSGHEIRKGSAFYSSPIAEMDGFHRPHPNRTKSSVEEEQPIKKEDLRRSNPGDRRSNTQAAQQREMWSQMQPPITTRITTSNSARTHEVLNHRRATRPNETFVNRLKERAEAGIRNELLKAKMEAEMRNYRPKTESGPLSLEQQFFVRLDQWAYSSSNAEQEKNKALVYFYHMLSNMDPERAKEFRAMLEQRIAYDEMQTRRVNHISRMSEAHPCFRGTLQVPTPIQSPAITRRLTGAAKRVEEKKRPDKQKQKLSDEERAARQKMRAAKQKEAMKAKRRELKEEKLRQRMQSEIEAEQRTEDQLIISNDICPKKHPQQLIGRETQFRWWTKAGQKEMQRRMQWEAKKAAFAREQREEVEKRGRVELETFSLQLQELQMHTEAVTSIERDALPSGTEPHYYQPPPIL